MVNLVVPMFSKRNWICERFPSSIIITIWLAVFGLIPAVQAAQLSAPSIRLSPDTIRVGAFYGGANVKIEGSVPPGSKVLVVIRGDEKDELFNRKGRLGPIWTNTDKVHIGGAPRLFLSFGDASSLLDRASIESYQLDEAAIKERVECRSHCKCGSSSGPHSLSLHACKGVDPAPQDRELIRTNYIALKQEEGSYQMHPEAVPVKDSGDSSLYDLNVAWPQKAPPGSYQVEVYACQNQTVVARSTTILKVAEVGFPAGVFALSRGHALLYGLMAVLAAAFGGFTTDAIMSRFRRRPSFRPSGGAGGAGADKAREEEIAHIPGH
jgi:hypothetical protein